ncbi:methyl-accepting chemotaxis protein [Geomonas ferrireducens]|uniref:methyl-accepting chemotaxis protein n=1 Tax=Geomonas ferrireducens TaxID=2570227 RepID=UPI0018E0B3F3|nr:methyl-accepting chemotaxis protein [Geomonas ferrireducens]
MKRFTSKRLSTKFFGAMIVLNLLTTTAFTVHTYYAEKKEILGDIDRELRTCVEGVRMVADGYHARMATTPPTPAEFQALSDRLTTYANGAGLNYIYTMVKKDGKIVFSSSSYTREEKEKGEQSKLFDTYEDASAGLKAAFDDGKPHYDQYSDKWGVFRSLFVPARGADGTEYVMGADISMKRIDSALRGVLVNCLVIALIVFVIGGAVMLVLVRSVQRTVGELARGVNLIAKGNLGTYIDHEGDDELGMLAHDMNRMAAQLKDVVAEVRNSAEEVAMASSRLSDTAAVMADGADKVHGQIGSVATAGEEMATTSGEIAYNCAGAAELARRANTTASSGAGVVAGAIEAMQHIAERVKESAQTVGGLGVRSEQIGEILGTIEDIADQTNLLALNAAIEAARAGEQGRGFAVVADEVRALAERTTRATKEIAEMIKVIQQETRTAVSSMEAGVAEVEKGSAEAGKSQQALREIMECIGEVTQQINQVATAAEEQTATTREISGNMQQITYVVQQTTQAAHDSAEAAEQLSQNATQLQSRVRQFQTD